MNCHFTSFPPLHHDASITTTLQHHSLPLSVPFNHPSLNRDSSDWAKEGGKAYEMVVDKEVGLSLLFATEWHHNGLFMPTLYNIIREDTIPGWCDDCFA